MYWPDAYYDCSKQLEIKIDLNIEFNSVNEQQVFQDLKMGYESKNNIARIKKNSQLADVQTYVWQSFKNWRRDHLEYFLDARHPLIIEETSKKILLHLDPSTPEGLTALMSIRLVLRSKAMREQVFASLAGKEIKPTVFDNEMFYFLKCALEYQKHQKNKPAEQKFFLNLEHLKFNESKLILIFKSLLPYIAASKTNYSIMTSTAKILNQLLQNVGLFKDYQPTRLIITNPHNQNPHSPMQQVKTLIIGDITLFPLKHNRFNFKKKFPNLNVIHIRKLNIFRDDDHLLNEIEFLGKLPDSLLKLSIEQDIDDERTFNLALLTLKERYNGILTCSRLKALEIINAYGQIPKDLPQTLEYLSIEFSVLEDAKDSFAPNFDYWSRYSLLIEIRLIGVSGHIPNFSCVHLKRLEFKMHPGYSFSRDLNLVKKCPNLTGIIFGNFKHRRLPESQSVKFFCIENEVLDEPNTGKSIDVLGWYTEDKAAIEFFDCSTCPNLISLELENFNLNLATAIFPEKLIVLKLKRDSFTQEEIAQALLDICKNFPEKLSQLIMSDVDYLQAFKSSQVSATLLTDKKIFLLEQAKQLTQLPERVEEIADFLNQLAKEPKSKKRKAEEIEGSEAVFNTAQVFDTASVSVEKEPKLES